MNNKRKIPQSAKQRQEAVVNKPKRENLKKKLIEKFANKFGVTQNNGIIVKEVTNFLQKDKINENDFKNLEMTIEAKITKAKSKSNLQQTLHSSIKNNNFEGDNGTNNEENDLNASNMSGASDLSNFDERGEVDKRNRQTVKNYQQKLNSHPKTEGYNEVEIDYDAYPDDSDSSVSRYE